MTAPGRSRSPGTRLGARQSSRQENIDARRRQNLALRLFLGGQRSYQAIADTPDPGRPGEPLYRNRGGAHKAVERAIARLTEDRAAMDALAVTLAELEVLQRSLWPVALADRPDRYDALSQLRWIFDHRAKLRGDYAPARATVEVITRDMVDAEIERLTREIADADAASAATLLDDPAELTATRGTDEFWDKES